MGDYDVAVVGLGPVGAMCANLLGQQGLRVVAMDKGDGDATKLRPRAISLDDESLRLIQAAGLMPQLAPSLRWKPGMISQGGLPLLSRWVSAALLRSGEGALLLGAALPGERAGEKRVVRLGAARDEDWEQERDLMPVTRAGWRAGASFYQPELERVLRDGLRRFPHVDVRWRTAAVGFDAPVGGAAAAVRTEESRAEWRRTAGGEWVLAEPARGGAPAPQGRVSARVVIACDGAASAARGVANPEAAATFGFRSLGFDEDWACVDVMLLDDAAARRLPQCTTQLCDPARPCTLVPGAWVCDHPRRGRHMRWEFKVLPADDRADFDQGSAFLRALLARWGLRDGEYEVVRSAVYQFHGLIAPRWRRGSLVLCGDACHCTPPFLGQGLNQGFRDAASLCWRTALVARGRAETSVFDAYQSEREGRVLFAVERSVQMGRVLNELSAAAEGAEQEAVAERLRRGDFDAPPRAGAAPAGAAAALPQPAGDVRLADGREGRLDDLIGGYRWCLLCRGAAAAPSPDVADVLRGAGAAVLLLSDEAADACGDVLQGRRAAVIRPDRTVHPTPAGVTADGAAAELRRVLGAGAAARL